MKERKRIFNMLYTEFKNIKNAPEIAKNISSVYSLGIISNCQVQN